MLSLKDFKLAKEKNSIDFGKLDEVLLQIDLDGDGKIDFQEFLTAAYDLKKVFTKDNISIAFKLFD